MAEVRYPPTNILQGGGVALVEALRGLDLFTEEGGVVVLQSEYDVKEVAFGYASASPVALFSTVAGERIKTASIEIVVPFDDPAAQLSVGYAGNVEAIIPVGKNIPSVVGKFLLFPELLFADEEAIRLYITRGESTQGVGVVYLSSDRND